MKNKTCGECRYYFEQANFCRLNAWECVEEDEKCCEDFKPPTNGDRIRQMSDGTLAFVMTRLILDGCPISGAKTIEDMKACKISTDCTDCLKQLLNQEAKDE
jgi:hypothetical protein